MENIYAVLLLHKSGKEVNEENLKKVVAATGAEIGPDEECRPCRMMPLASLYLTVLQKAGKTEDAKELEKVYETGDILTIAEFMDKIKMRAEDGLRQSLEGLDCFAQSFEMEAEGAPKEE